MRDARRPGDAPLASGTCIAGAVTTGVTPTAGFLQGMSLVLISMLLYNDVLTLGGRGQGAATSEEDVIGAPRGEAFALAETTEDEE